MFLFSFKKNKVLKNVTTIRSSYFKDKRGYLYTKFNNSIKNKILKKKFTNIDDKFIIRKKNSLTGIHGDKKTWKLLSCISGKIELVLVNCDEKSSKFGDHAKFLLSGNDFKSVLIPPLIGNSYLCLSNKTIVFYKLFYNGKYVDKDDQFTFSWRDKRFNIKWSRKKNLILSKRDNL
jgi:dTDP-4-dehydrorhamnose 3,5-epimerase